MDILERLEIKLQKKISEKDIEEIIMILALFIYRSAERYKGVDYEREYGRPLAVLMKQLPTKGPLTTSQCLTSAIKTAFFLLTTSLRQVHKK